MNFQSPDFDPEQPPSNTSFANGLMDMLAEIKRQKQLEEQQNQGFFGTIGSALGGAAGAAMGGPAGFKVGSSLGNAAGQAGGRAF